MDEEWDFSSHKPARLNLMGFKYKVFRPTNLNMGCFASCISPLAFYSINRDACILTEDWQAYNKNVPNWCLHIMTQRCYKWWEWKSSLIALKILYSCMVFCIFGVQWVAPKSSGEHIQGWNTRVFSPKGWILWSMFPFAIRWNS